jgi:hypothetical protein
MPKKKEVYTESLEVCLTEKQKREIKKAAKISKMSCSEYIRTVIFNY